MTSHLLELWFCSWPTSPSLARAAELQDEPWRAFGSQGPAKSTFLMWLRSPFTEPSRAGTVTCSPPSSRTRTKPGSVLPWRGSRSSPDEKWIQSSGVSPKGGEAD